MVVMSLWLNPVYSLKFLKQLNLAHFTNCDIADMSCVLSVQLGYEN